jgi:hypothetical protein
VGVGAGDGGTKRSFLSFPLVLCLMRVAFIREFREVLPSVGH